MNFNQYLKSVGFNCKIFNESKSDRVFLNTKKNYDLLFNNEMQVILEPYGWDIDVYVIQNKLLICKDNIIYYKNDFEYLPNTWIKKYSKGISQLKFLINYLSNLPELNQLSDCLLKIKYIVNNINYDKKHKIILKEYYKNVKVISKFGKIKLIDSGEQSQIDKLPIKFDIDRVIFKGILNSEYNLKKGCNDGQLLKLIEQNKNIFTYNNYENFYNQLKDIFFKIKSKYGESGEYIVKIILNDETIIIKNPSFKIENEKDGYYKEIKNFTLNLLQNINIKTFKSALDTFNEDLKMLKIESNDSDKFRCSIKLDNEKCTEIKDAIYEMGRQMIISKLPGNNNCLILGKFKILTNGHIKIINKALSEYDSVTICLLGNYPYREDMIKSMYKNVDIISNYNANFKDIFNKIDKNISVILTGTNNVKNYRESVKNFPNVTVKEYYQSSDSVSGDMILNRINNKEYFNKNTPFKIHDFYDQLLNHYQIITK